MRKLTGWLVAGAMLAWVGQGWSQVAMNASHADPAVRDQSDVPNANPALWKVQGAHQTVYLFGTVHMMKPDVRWQTKKVTDALAASGSVYLEVAKVDDVAAAQPIVMQLGLDQQHPLSTKISAEDKDALDKAVKEMGMPGEQMLEPMQPWLAYMTLSVLPMVKAGYSPTGGVDVTIAKLAKEQDKPVLGFETIEQQLHYLADFPQAQQVKLLHEELQELPEGPRQMNEIIGDWTHGDVDDIGRLENAAVAKSPELYKKLVTERNDRFADQIAELLSSDKPGTVFVAVGAAHLAGADSIQKDLEAKGFKVTRQ